MTEAPLDDIIYGMLQNIRPNYSIAGIALNIHETDTSSISCTSYGSLSPLGVIHECRVMNEPWALSDVAQSNSKNGNAKKKS